MIKANNLKIVFQIVCNQTIVKKVSLTLMSVDFSTKRFCRRLEKNGCGSQQSYRLMGLTR